MWRSSRLDEHAAAKAVPGVSAGTLADAYAAGTTGLTLEGVSPVVPAAL